ncbi:sporulation sigma-E factor-processing peptidase [Brevibacillus agri]|uniref:Sigma-E processing peptidase SpoIIGA n=1 Tax=Brevibacillus agri TaxID=51101 RepID=A0A3M8AYZ1_9BACL|nr:MULTISPECIES: sigma-E processing peptidase SpoIIGA [Brevibacillus]ELK40804.1 sporulation sigma-E factor processing peptidase [Brevibacillus agri BAB-2500]EJL42412.1 sigma-E processing peptidase SpoIIGA [Brevibacillus sp. CF112]MBG9565035.1 peptidase [Brevibacillus agri]MBY0051162.1 sigma-E processing peptidase SpoIIGA [Brevibacillus agri]MCG5250445.1 sigma-E processing peptidase SpoIIGA [Brevibacillus agri]
MVVYLDIILLLNLAIDTLLLWFTAYFRKERVVWWRMIAAALFGCSYLVFFFFPAFSSMYQWSVKLLFSILMLWIAFGNRRLLSFAQNLIIFYFVAFVFGGGVFGLQYFLAPQNEIVNGLVVTHNDGFGVGFKPTLAIVAVGFTLVFFLGKKSYKAIQEPRRIETFLVDVVVTIAKEKVICRGLVDTGNQLHEPITRLPVMIIESRMLAHLLPPSLLRQTDENGGVWEKLDGSWDDLPIEWQSRVRLIPYRSVSRGMDFLLAIKPDHVLVVQEGLRYETEKVLIGLNPIPLSADGKYQAIVHPAMMEAYTQEPTFILKQEG